jgi:hypothetical protein
VARRRIHITAGEESWREWDSHEQPGGIIRYFVVVRRQCRAGIEFAETKTEEHARTVVICYVDQYSQLAGRRYSKTRVSQVLAMAVGDGWTRPVHS